MRPLTRRRPAPAPQPEARDPAPSRLRYRMQRWMLTPGIRLALRIGIPFALVFGATSLYLADQGRRDALTLFVSELRRQVEERPEFMVGLMAVDGAGPAVAEDIREVVPLDFPVSSFDLDLEQIRATVMGLDPVESASVRIRPGGILQIDVVERLPVVVWRTRDGVELLDETGNHVATIPARSARPDLPLIAGEGADAHVEEALRLLAAAAPLRERLRGLVRVSERRWDVVLDRGQRIMLPETGAVRALERALALDEARDLLARDVAAVDLRLPGRPTLRMTESGAETYRQIRAQGAEATARGQDG